MGRRLNCGNAFRIVKATVGTTASSRGNGFMHVLLLLRGGAIALSAAPCNAFTGGGMRQSGGGFSSPNNEDSLALHTAAWLRTAADSPGAPWATRLDARDVGVSARRRERGGVG